MLYWYDFIQIGTAIPVYTDMFSVYHLFTIRYGKDQTIMAQTYELIMYTYTLIPPGTTIIMGVASKIYFNWNDALMG